MWNVFSWHVDVWLLLQSVLVLFDRGQKKKKTFCFTAVIQNNQKIFYHF